MPVGEQILGVTERVLDVPILCEASGVVSERRVRSAFYECYQMSPTAYLRATALNTVRRELVEGSRLRNAVSHAATDWGFGHLSRFAAQYRAPFGESPRHTLSHRTDRPQAAAK
jgi:AraC family ethanolamine operon transcriptional activator